MGRYRDVSRHSGKIWHTAMELGEGAARDFAFARVISPTVTSQDEEATPHPPAPHFLTTPREFHSVPP